MNKLFALVISFLAVSALMLPAGCGVSSSGNDGRSYLVGGSISGLYGTGLVLQNNGSDTITITDNGRFSFPDRVKDGGSCSVSVQTQPTNPSQICTVLNGDRSINGADVRDIEVKCMQDFTETFDGGHWNPKYWLDNGKFDRMLSSGELKYELQVNDVPARSFIEVRGIDPSRTSSSMSADLKVLGINQNASTDPRVWFHGFFYHTTTPGEASGLRTGDVVAQVQLQNTVASYEVFKCLTSECDTSEDIEYLTPGSGAVPFGTVPLQQTANLTVDWNNLNPNKFTFQLDSNTPVTFDPVAAGAPISKLTANSPGKWLGLRIRSVEQGENCQISAAFDNVMLNNVPYDDFNSGTYIDSSLWENLTGRRSVENSQLVLEIAKEYSGDAAADERFHGTELVSHPDLMLDSEAVEANVAISADSLVIQTGGSVTEALAVVELDLQPPGSEGYNNLFAVQGVLQMQDGQLAAGLVAYGCADADCNTLHAISNQVQTFNSTISLGTSYHLRVEHTGAGNVDVTLDGSETLSVDLSEVAEFASSVFKQARLRTRAGRTDSPGEEAVFKAIFDNAKVGSP